MAGKPHAICFSDIDGTLVHYPTPAQFSELTGDIILLTQSSTGKTGVISRATLEKAALLRRSGVLLVIETGARTATLMQRLAHLPASDAFVSENGGRIWYPDPAGLTAAPLQEDMEWRASHAGVAGPASQDMVPAAERKGPLWDWYRELLSQGWKLDANSYSTAFRLSKTPGKSTEDMTAAISARPSSLACTFNLGTADFYPTTSGKENAARYLMARFGIKDVRKSAFLCDDDNDLPLAALVGKAFLPSIGSESVQLAFEQHPERFVAAKSTWTAGTEEMLDAVLAYLAPDAATTQGNGRLEPVGASA